MGTVQSSPLLIWFTQQPPGKHHMQITMTGSLSNHLIERDKNNAISIYKESAKYNFSHLVPSSLPASQKGLSTTNTPLQQHKNRLWALNMCFLLQVTPSTAVHRQIYSGNATDHNFSIFTWILAATSGSLVLWQSALPSGSHCDKDRLDGENNCKICTMVKSVKLVLSV